METEKKRGPGRPRVAPENRAKKQAPVSIYADKDTRSMVQQILQIETGNPDPDSQEIDAWISGVANRAVEATIRQKRDYYAKEGVIIAPTSSKSGKGKGKEGAMII
jgi:hypothetical protein